MHYLIDGHNLIARMPDIALDDPNDEAKLVARLRTWAGTGRRRRVTVIFDGGLPGGKSNELSQGNVTVIFAPGNSTADALLIKRIRSVSNPPEYTLVSSDGDVIAVAAQRRMPYLHSETFAAQMAEEARGSPGRPQTAESLLNAEEVAGWLELFGPEPERPKKPPPPKRQLPDEDKPPVKSPSQQPARPDKSPTPTTRKRARRKLTAEEVDEWLAIFGDQEE